MKYLRAFLDDPPSDHLPTTPDLGSPGRPARAARARPEDAADVTPLPTGPPRSPSERSRGGSVSSVGSPPDEPAVTARPREHPGERSSGPHSATPELCEWIEERAAFLEYEAGLPRAEAERRAFVLALDGGARRPHGGSAASSSADQEALQR